MNQMNIKLDNFINISKQIILDKEINYMSPEYRK